MGSEVMPAQHDNRRGETRQRAANDFFAPELLTLDGTVPLKNGAGWDVMAGEGNEAIGGRRSAAPNDGGGKSIAVGDTEAKLSSRACRLANQRSRGGRYDHSRAG